MLRHLIFLPGMIHTLASESLSEFEIGRLRKKADDKLVHLRLMGVACLVIFWLISDFSWGILLGSGIGVLTYGAIVGVSAFNILQDCDWEKKKILKGVLRDKKIKTWPGSQYYYLVINDLEFSVSREYYEMCQPGQHIEIGFTPISRQVVSVNRIPPLYTQPSTAVNESRVNFGAAELAVLRRKAARSFLLCMLLLPVSGIGVYWLATLILRMTSSPDGSVIDFNRTFTDETVPADKVWSAVVLLVLACLPALIEPFRTYLYERKGGLKVTSTGIVTAKLVRRDRPRQWVALLFSTGCYLEINGKEIAVPQACFSALVQGTEVRLHRSAQTGALLRIETTRGRVVYERG